MRSSGRPVRRGTGRQRVWLLPGRAACPGTAATAGAARQLSTVRRLQLAVRPSVRTTRPTDRPTDWLTDRPSDRPFVRPSVRSTDRPRMTSLTAQLYSHTSPPVISCSLRLSWSRSSLVHTLSFSLFASPWWSPPSPSLSQFLSLSPPLSLSLSRLWHCPLVRELLPGCDTYL